MGDDKHIQRKNSILTLEGKERNEAIVDWYIEEMGELRFKQFPRASKQFQDYLNLSDDDKYRLRHKYEFWSQHEVANDVQQRGIVNSYNKTQELSIKDMLELTESSIKKEKLNAKLYEFIPESAPTPEPTIDWDN